jgi:hypothetical protein
MEYTRKVTLWFHDRRMPLGPSASTWRGVPDFIGDSKCGAQTVASLERILAALLAHGTAPKTVA